MRLLTLSLAAFAAGFIITGAVAIAADSDTDSKHDTPAPHPTKTPAKTKPMEGKPAPRSQENHEWSYAGLNGPEQWGRLKPEYELCGIGKKQSPIDLDGGGLTAQTDPVELDYRPTPLALLNNGHAVQVNYPAGSRLRAGRDVYELVQLHFHTPSEHLFSGHSRPMEMHLVHKAKNGELAVIAVSFEVGDQNLVLEEIWRHMPMNKGEPREIKEEIINARDLTPADLSYHRYMGSLTTPPCSEGVNWFVIEAPLTASREQVMRLAKAVRGDNARPPQPLNGRLVVHPAMTKS